MTLEDKFWARVDRDGPMAADGTRCWIWIGRKTGKGYGQFGFMGARAYAHRLSWEEANDRQIPSGLDIDHLCRRHECVSPLHLEPVTRSENIRRGVGVGRMWKDAVASSAISRRAWQACRNGHPYTAENTIVIVNGWRVCRTCRRAASSRYYQKKRSSK